MLKKIDKRLFVMLSFVAVGMLTNESFAQLIPLPSGKFEIGHHRIEWVDSSRTEILSENNGKRRLIADIWYPAKHSREAKVAYLDTQIVYKALGSKGLQSFFGPFGATAIRSGSVQTHAYQDAPFDPSLKSAPVIFFSHGMGMITQLYTSQIEEFASHGYIVVALNHPYDAWLVGFKDGTTIPLEMKQRKAAGDSEEQHIAYENKRVDWWASDIIFALNQLVNINKKKTGGIPFAGRMDLSKIGAMGHSVGGRAAARACQLDPRFKSCANQDGVANMQPFYRDSKGVGMKQSFLLFERDLNGKLSREDAASMGMKFDELLQFVDSLRRDKAAALASTGGTFHILLKFRGTSHVSFADLPLLQAKSSTDASMALQILQVTTRYTREFFDKTLLAVPAPLFEGKTMLKYIDVIQQFPPGDSINR